LAFIPGGTLSDAFAEAVALSGRVEAAPPFCAQPAASTLANSNAVQILTLMFSSSLFMATRMLLACATVGWCR
jgi:hypothetical protein